MVLCNLFAKGQKGSDTSYVKWSQIILKQLLFHCKHFMNHSNQYAKRIMILPNQKLDSLDKSLIFLLQ